MMRWGDELRSAAWRVAGAVSMAVLLAACGGGQQVDKFVPARIVAFGDENSVITSGGAKYTVNYVDPTSGLRDCTLDPIWIQVLAKAYGLVFAQCNPNPPLPTTSQIAAQPGAKVADVKTQIDNFIARPDAFSEKDLVTVLAGTNDVLEQYALMKSASPITEAQAKAVLEQRGLDLASQVNRIAQAGGKVLIATIPDVGTTPFGVAEGAAGAATLSRLTTAFNENLEFRIAPDDGHKIGLILDHQTLSSIVTNLSLANVKDPACDAQHIADVTTCRTDTLFKDPNGDTTKDASVTTWLWADMTHLSPAGHKTLGDLAVTRANGNPF